MKRNGTNFVNALILLLILTTAYAGKVLHTHPDAYYQSLEQTRTADNATTIVDDCPICHFHFFSYLNTESLHLTTSVSFLGIISARPVTSVAAEPVSIPSLRAPPVSGHIR